jgi:hypothetical protein
MSRFDHLQHLVFRYSSIFKHQRILNSQFLLFLFNLPALRALRTITLVLKPANILSPRHTPPTQATVADLKPDQNPSWRHIDEWLSKRDVFPCFEGFTMLLEYLYMHGDRWKVMQVTGERFPMLQGSARLTVRR